MQSRDLWKTCTSLQWQVTVTHQKEFACCILTSKWSSLTQASYVNGMTTRLPKDDLVGKMKSQKEKKKKDQTR